LRVEESEIDLTVDPPAGVIIEVEITASAIRKFGVVAKVGVAEVWRHDGDRIASVPTSPG